jgi:2-amino-4-hydroxy-6-hydroxymethyldihydropteridine diphosphokinase/dihydroneopterin aldolase
VIELVGLELWGHHGVEEAEQEAGQRFLFDVTLEEGDAAQRSDRLEDTIDYREVVAVVQEVSDSRRFHLLEALSAAVADALMERFPVRTATVRVRKPDVDLGVPIVHAAVTVHRLRASRTRAFVGLGSNLGDRETNLRRAIDLLAAEPGIAVQGVSSFRETDPVDYEEQPKFLNAAVFLGTELSPHALLERLLQIERRLGRTRDGPRFGPRTIDLDLLVYDGVRIDEPGLTVPHPRLHERRFALEPLAELDRSLVVPGHGPVEDLLAALD